MDRRTLTTWMLAGAVAVALAPAVGEAQDRGRGGRTTSIPPGHLPPPGECRVWYDDRPPGQQPPPTSCDAARREADRTRGRLIYGDERRDERRDDRECDEKDRRKGECDRDDRDRDRDRDACIDRDRDGRCDYDGRYPDDRRYPETLPETVWGVIFGRGDRRAVEGAREWLGRNDVSPRYTDADRDGRPESVGWYDGRGTLLQRWVDTNRDGRADRVTIYENGRAVRVIQ